MSYVNIAKNVMDAITTLSSPIIRQCRNCFPTYVPLFSWTCHSTDFACIQIELHGGCSIPDMRCFVPASIWSHLSSWRSMLSHLRCTEISIRLSTYESEFSYWYLDLGIVYCYRLPWLNIKYYKHVSSRGDNQNSYSHTLVALIPIPSKVGPHIIRCVRNW